MSGKRPSQSIASVFSGSEPKKVRTNAYSHLESTPSRGSPHSTPNGQGSHFNESAQSMFSPPASVKNARKTTVFNDPIHGNITMEGLCLRIIDTRQFQRLRNLKQLGTCSFVYPGAAHSRFEHSIGVAHYAAKMARTLQTNQPHLGINEVDVLCVMVAGLCHDLGHGPFSHMYDGVFMKRLVPEAKRHEDVSVDMLEYLLKERTHQGDNIEEDLKHYKLKDNDMIFIKEIIRGTKERERKGRDNTKFYLYDIVNNCRSGLDVDKLDYFRRDMRYSNAAPVTCNFDRFIENGRVYKADPIDPSDTAIEEGHDGNHYMICYPEKMVKEAVSVFSQRFHLHTTIYTHKTVKKVEFMLTDAMVKANDFLKLKGTITPEHPDGKYTMADAVNDPVAFSYLDDQIIKVIELSEDPRMEESQELIRQLQSRDFYSHQGRSTYKRGSWLHTATDEMIEDKLIALSKKLLEEQAQALSSQPVTSTQDSFSAMDSPVVHSQDSVFVDALRRNSATALLELVKGDVIVDKMHIHYGKKDKNPVDYMRFFPKDADEHEHVAKKVKEDVYESILPRTFEELAVRVFCRYPSKGHSLYLAFDRLCKIHDAPAPFPSQVSENGNASFSQSQSSQFQIGSALDGLDSA
ncbi:hypothetical protein B484DRAFT_453878 [Ochromonadaceae sp. CCMP2298]|nr:hypothetical protein B484DRAFT_453878 [Ochromonadaceae sp. CCMP2298]